MHARFRLGKTKGEGGDKTRVKTKTRFEKKRLWIFARQDKKCFTLYAILSMREKKKRKRAFYDRHLASLLLSSKGATTRQSLTCDVGGARVPLRFPFHLINAGFDFEETLRIYGGVLFSFRQSAILARPLVLAIQHDTVTSVGRLVRTKVALRRQRWYRRLAFCI